MPFDLTKNNLKIFNRTYGTKLDIKKYLDLKKVVSEEDALKTILFEAYRQIAINDLSTHWYKDPKSIRVFEDFNDDIISSLRWDCENQGMQKPPKNIGMNKLEAYEFINDALTSELPNNDVDMIAENYKNGGIRIRDMVEKATAATAYGSRPRSLDQFVAYAEALKKVNENRSFLWRVFHPIRNHAEKRDAATIKNLMINCSTAVDYNNAKKRVNSSVSGLKALQAATVQHMLGVSDVKEYVPDKENTDLNESMDSVDIKYAKFMKLINNSNEQSQEKEAPSNQQNKESVNVSSLKEDPYINSENNDQIDPPDISSPVKEQSL